jgi:large subunit ribosomal protein L35
MPKMKSKSGAKKRFSATGSGKFKRGSKARRHLLTRKAQKRKRQLRNQRYVSKADEKSVARMLPYAR